MPRVGGKTHGDMRDYTQTMISKSLISHFKLAIFGAARAQASYAKLPPKGVLNDHVFGPATPQYSGAAG